MQGMKTEITDLLKIKYPILNAGMDRVACPNLVAAVTDAGGFGVLGVGIGDPDSTRGTIRRMRELTNKPFGINCPLAVPNGRQNAVVALEERVPMINYSMGKGDWIADEVHSYGGKVIASVNSVELAIKAQEQGADAIIAAGHEAAGHSGELTTFVMIPRLVELLDIPVIAAGGIANGRGLAAALTLGASGVSMGTRFWTTTEGPTHYNWKLHAVESEITDTLYSDRFDGIPSRQMNSELSRKLLTDPVGGFQLIENSLRIARVLRQSPLKLILAVLDQGPEKLVKMAKMAFAYNAHSITLSSGSLEKGMMSAGQSVGLVHDIPSVAEVIDRVVREAKEAMAGLQVQFGQ